MSYNVTTTAGTTLASIAAGTVNSVATSLTLIGKNYAGYGIFLNENYVRLLENFSNGVPPTAALTGQLWYDNTQSVLKVYNGTSWKPISSSASSSSSPSNPVTGDLWWDTNNVQLKVWSGSSWVTIGPVYSTISGTSGAIVETILDNASISRVIVKFYISNSVIAILSKDSEFTPQTSIAGFTTIKPGMNLISASTLTGAQFTGDASNALQVAGVTGTSYLRNDQNTTTNYQLTVGGLIVSTDLTITSVAGAVSLTNSYTNGDLNLWVKRSTGGDTKAIGINGTTAAVTLPGNFITQSNASVTGNLTTTGYTLSQGITIASNTILPNANNTINIGSTGTKFANIYATTFIGNLTGNTSGIHTGNVTGNLSGNTSGVHTGNVTGNLTGNVSGTAVTALYADLAERFETDLPLVPGTVVELGGLKEITTAVMELSEAVFGVISTNAGFLMNGGAGNDTTHPPVAVNGRVPVRVLGLVKKGDRLVSAGRGLARAALRSEMTAFNVIGRALENKETTEEGTIEAIVKLNS